MVCKARASEIGWCPVEYTLSTAMRNWPMAVERAMGLGVVGQSLAVDNHNLWQGPLAGNQKSCGPWDFVGENRHPRR